MIDTGHRLPDDGVMELTADLAATIVDNYFACWNETDPDRGATSSSEPGPRTPVRSTRSQT